MNHTPDAAAGDGGAFDPRQAARAVLVLAALGAVWLSVRGQHPYRAPRPRTSPSWSRSLWSTSPQRSPFASAR